MAYFSCSTEVLYAILMETFDVGRFFKDPTGIVLGLSANRTFELNMIAIF